VGKRIVLCFDGTANQLGAGNRTNVAKLFEMLEKNDPASQLSYYERIACCRCEKAFGLGLKNNVAQAYLYWCRGSTCRQVMAHIPKCVRCNVATASGGPLT
jgi:uncharacterized protein (DUF2235 family)